MIDPPPSVLAAREAGDWPVNLSYRFMLLMSVPAIAFAESHVMPARYLLGASRPTRDESYWIVAIAFVLSTAWWTTVGGLAASALAVRPIDVVGT